MANDGYDIDFEALGLSAERFDAFVSVFRHFDKANTGAISPKQLEALCFRLGESFDTEELAAARASLENEQTGLVHFAVFLPWWLSSE